MVGAARAWFSDNIETLVPGRNFKSLNQERGGGVERRIASNIQGVVEAAQNTSTNVGEAQTATEHRGADGEPATGSGGQP